MSKHTPGPWWIEGNKGETLLQVWGSTHGAGPRWVVNIEAEGPSGPVRAAEEDKANAHLIAAAPELLAACEQALNESGCDGDLCMHRWHDTMRSVIAKARGES